MTKQNKNKQKKKEIRIKETNKTVAYVKKGLQTPRACNDIL